MMNKKKKLTVTLATMMALGTVLSACGGGNNNTNTGAEATKAPAASEGATNSGAPDTSKEVKLKMILLGPQPGDYDKVFGELNTKLKEKINATVETEFLDWSDWTPEIPAEIRGERRFRPRVYSELGLL